jgi:hypothetical protein
MTQEAKTVLTPEVQAMVGVKGDIVECWGVVDKEYLRRFTQAIMDPDPRYWDEEFAKGTRYGEIIAPPIMVSYLPGRLPPGEEDPITRAFRENPQSDGIGGVRRRGTLPDIPTHLRRRLNAGNEIEVYKYPSLGDKIYYQNSYQNIRERVGRDGNPFLIVTTETRFWNQKGELLCITRQSSIIR